MSNIKSFNNSKIKFKKISTLSGNSTSCYSPIGIKGDMVDVSTIMETLDGTMNEKTNKMILKLERL